MKRFVFRLERLLQLRSSAERQEVRTLGEAVQAEDRARHELEAAASRQTNAQGQLAGRSKAPAGVLMNLERTVDVFSQRVVAAQEASRAAAHDGHVHEPAEAA